MGMFRRRDREPMSLAELAVTWVLTLIGIAALVALLVGIGLGAVAVKLF